jgi:hypothetical protein
MIELVKSSLLYTVFGKEVLYMVPPEGVLEIVLHEAVAEKEEVSPNPIPETPLGKIEPLAIPKELIQEAPIGPKYAGNYSNKILIMYANGGVELASELHLLAEKILQAKGVLASDCAFLDIDVNSEFTPRELLRILQPEFILSFGLSLGVGGNYVLTVTGKISMIKADSLDILSKNDELKKKLWMALKPLVLPGVI